MYSEHTPIAVRSSIRTKYIELHAAESGALTVFHPNGAHISTKSYSDAGHECVLVEVSKTGSVVHIGNYNSLPYMGVSIPFLTHQPIVLSYECGNNRVLYKFDPSTREVTPYEGETPWWETAVRLHIKYSDIHLLDTADKSIGSADAIAFTIALTKADLYVLSLFRRTVIRLNNAGYCRQRYDLAAEFIPEAAEEYKLTAPPGTARISVEKDYVILSGASNDNRWRFFIESTELECLIDGKK